ncbi:MAG: PQQ-binding-like beta-propeller repeat protein, partial [Thermoguttaceae bacterium]
KQGRDEDVVAWPTEHGVLSRARIDHGDQGAMIPTYELKTDAAITSRLAYLPPNPKVRGDLGLLFATSTGGYVYAVTELRGNLAWKFPTSEPVLQPPAVIEDRVYVPTQLGGMFCCEAKSGRQLWWAPQVLQFVAASKQRVYAADRTGRTEVLDAMTGARLDVLSTEPLPLKLLNVQTDRLYLATDTGLVQCLHEIEQTRPILHGEDRKVKREEEAAKPLPSVKKPKSEPAEGEPKPKPKAATKAKPADKSAKKTPAKAINGAKKKQAEDSN